MLFYPLVLIAVMLFRPQGLLGMKEFSFVRLWERLPDYAARVRGLINRKGKQGGMHGGN